MFIGEAPGRTENDTGVPFQGQSGRILTQIFDYTRTAFRILITNVVCCQPKDLVQVNNKDFLDVDFTTVPLDSKDPDYEKRRRAIAATLTAENHNRNPAPFEIRACAPHITELEREYHPQGIVLLGLIATQAKISTQCPILNLKHPAAIARMEFKVIPMKQEARKLQKFIEEIRESS
jgi:uracil-DNA glycosylase